MAKAFTLKNGTILLSTEAPGGLYNSAQLKKIAAICDGGTAVVKATEDQRIAMFVKEGEAAKVAKELRAIGLGIRNYQDGLHQPITCIGELCADHEQDALGSAMELTQSLSEIALAASLKIGINGCHRCCVPCHTFDISIIGDNSGYRISLGGKNSQIPEMASFVAEGVPYEKLAHLIRNVVELYRQSAEEGESLQDVMDRVGVGGFISVLAPYSQDAAAGADNPFGDTPPKKEPIASPAEADIAAESVAEDDIGEEITITEKDQDVGHDDTDVAIDEELIAEDDFSSEVLISEDHFAPSVNKQHPVKNTEAADEGLMEEQLVDEDLTFEDDLADDSTNEHEELVMEATDELMDSNETLVSAEDALALDAGDAGLIQEADEQTQLEDLDIGVESIAFEEDETILEEEPLFDEKEEAPEAMRSTTDDLTLGDDEENSDRAAEDEIVLDDDPVFADQDADDDALLMEEDSSAMEDESLLIEEESLGASDDALLAEESLTEDAKLALADEDLLLEDDAPQGKTDKLGVGETGTAVAEDSELNFINEDPSQIEEDTSGQLESTVEETIREEQLSRQQEEKDMNAAERLAMMRSLKEEKKTSAVRSIHSAATAKTPLKGASQSHGKQATFAFSGMDFGAGGEVVLAFSTGMQLTISSDLLAEGARELTIAGKTIRFFQEESGCHVEVDGITMFLPYTACKAV